MLQVVQVMWPRILLVGTSGAAFEGVRLQDMFLAGNTSRSAPKTFRAGWEEWNCH